jgi:glycosyltransferase involved in cell wall biosynthesis
MKILLNDYSGHAFTYELGLKISSYHNVFYCYADFFQTPKADFNSKKKSLRKICTNPISIKKKFNKYNFFTRIGREISYGEEVINLIKKSNSQLVICANTPLNPLLNILKYCKRNNIKSIFWMQDIYAEAIKKLLNKKFYILGTLISFYFYFLEKRCEKIADQIIIISNDFKKFLNKESLKKTHYIENWSAYDKINKNHKNYFKKKLNPQNKFCLIYSGTIGMKHDSQIFFNILEKLPNILIIISSEGKYAEKIRSLAYKNKVNLELIKWIEPKYFYSFLSMADAFLVTLNKEASEISVPSKIYSYLYVGKPILGVMPKNNLGAKKIIQHKSGYIISPDNTDALVDKIKNIIASKNKNLKFRINKQKYLNDKENSLSKLKKIINFLNNDK